MDELIQNVPPSRSDRVTDESDQELPRVPVLWSCHYRESGPNIVTRRTQSSSPLARAARSVGCDKRTRSESPVISDRYGDPGSCEPKCHGPALDFVSAEAIPVARPGPRTASPRTPQPKSAAQSIFSHHPTKTGLLEQDHKPPLWQTGSTRSEPADTSSHITASIPHALDGFDEINGQSSVSHSVRQSD